MGPLLTALKGDARASNVQDTDHGFILTGSGEAFSALAREAMEKSGVEYVALPTSDGAVGYTQVVIIPL
ncbi:hypothetical protein QOZ96_000684 [Brevundimonas nasdae]|jgi:hypothetical protein|uniref:hypothetical protein n=1 Tax=Brevundimonas nasdae TaxID=172043 RepID=UPI001912FD60|nr:hypothetical protein [Brevundimonas nasdae]MBK6024098.1 hypothetical protein [Brevundimonas nasdae]MDQ0450753.1 hypothetical protein [Brevundimonas nasdae]